ncbi:hypothetical protein CPB84DRAFT_1790517 [Gymnopilus junonius]|uniref:F-box domain-containing protein n=1 Tax=Gymnopilus junonius TaxID=109634 RepID=A0A9P5THV9_GYMJU|nr:hypothetical protein CPB84DRAFT_1790517 [Gymnopilus junonius]
MDLDDDNDNERSMDSSGIGVMKREAQPDFDFPAHKRLRNDEHLSPILDIPEDILYEIIQHLDPFSVLHLAQLSRGFRSILMSKSSSGIWKASRANVPSLPDLRTGLSEPRYIDFMFNNERCQSCLRQRGDVYVCYPAFSRTCSTCLRIHFHVANDKWERSYQGDLKRLRTYIPTIKVRQSKWVPARDGRKWVTLYHKNTDWLWKDQYSRAGYKKEWVKAKIEERKSIFKNTESYIGWCEERKYRQEEERRERIIKRICQLGWGNELNRCVQCPADSPVIIKACQKELTDQDLFNLEPSLNQLMQNLQQRRLDEERAKLLCECFPGLKSILEAFVRTLPPNSIYPSVVDVSDDPCINEILTISNTPDLSEQSCKAISDHLPQVTQDWIEQKTNEVLISARKMLRLHHEIGSETILPSSALRQKEGLNLTIISFECSVCKRQFRPWSSLRYPKVLMHGAYYHRTLSTAQPQLNKVFENTSWNEGDIMFNPATMTFMAEIVRLCGLDPRTTTASDMDLLNPSIKCMTCKWGKGPAMGWTEVIAHKQIDHGSGNATFNVKLKRRSHKY